mmetsp:Transcript_53320/g.77859  ORF Transcript_53320/g.77859 Transcript_53320/m.77859 type:complete len:85 (+) Transcript_53320:192-446(+)
MMVMVAAAQQRIENGGGGGGVRRWEEECSNSSSTAVFSFTALYAKRHFPLSISPSLRNGKKKCTTICCSILLSDILNIEGCIIS